MLMLIQLEPRKGHVTNPKSFLPLNPREFLVLYVLVDNPRYGYGIVRAVDEQSDGDVRLDPANLYRIIKRLMRDGLVGGAGTAQSNENERRRFYEITDLGRSVLAAEASRLDRLMAGARSKNLIARRQRSL